MVLVRRSGSSDDLERFLSSSSLKKKPNHKKFSSHPPPKPTSTKNEPLRSNIRNPACNSIRTGATTTFRHVEKDPDLDIQLGIDKFINDKECMWLSSDCSSPPCFTEDDLIPWLSTLTISQINLGAEEILRGKLKDMEKEASPLNSPQNTSSSSEISFTDRTSFSLSLTDLDEDSLVDLDGEYSDWISDTESELDFFKSSFPSPYCRSDWGSEFKSSNSDVSVHTVGTDSDLFTYLEDSIADEEPLFWPFDSDHEWRSEKAWKSFSMSPCKSMASIKTSPAIKLQSHSRKMDKKHSCRRRLDFDSISPPSKSSELKQCNGNKVEKETNNTLPPRVKKSNKSLLKAVPLDDTMAPMEGKHVCSSKSISPSGICYHEEISIETLLGLHEFNGHEGIDSDLNEDMFFLELPL